MGRVSLPVQHPSSSAAGAAEPLSASQVVTGLPRSAEEEAEELNLDYRDQQQIAEDYCFATKMGRRLHYKEMARRFGIYRRPARQRSARFGVHSLPIKSRTTCDVAVMK